MGHLSYQKVIMSCASLPPIIGREQPDDYSDEAERAGALPTFLTCKLFMVELPP